MGEYRHFFQQVAGGTRRPWMLWVVLPLLFVATNTWGQILTLTPSLAVGERYDDNIFQRNDKTDDFVTIVTPGIRLLYIPVSDTELNFAYHPSFEFFADNSNQNHVAQRLSLRFTSPLARRLSLRVSDDLTFTEEPRDRFEEIEDVTGLRPVSRERRERTLRNRATGDLQLQLAPKSTLGLLFDSLLEDVNVPEEVDEFRYTVGLEFGYLLKATRGTRASLLYDVTFHTFSANEGAPPLAAADFRVHTIQVGFRHNFSQTLLTNAAVGYALIDADDPAVDGDGALIAVFNLIKTLRTGEASFRYRRQFISGRGEGNVVLIDQFILSFAFRPTPKIILDIKGNMSLLDFQESTTRTADRDRRFWTVRPGLTYEVLRFWRLAVAYDFRYTDFNDATEADRADHRFAFTSQLVLQDWLFLDLTYYYSLRQFEMGRNDDEFDRNEIMLSITYAPTFRL